MLITPIPDKSSPALRTKKFLPKPGFIRGIAADLINSLKTFASNITGQNGSYNAGYEIGKIVFEVIVEYLTVGIGKVAKFADSTKLFDKIAAIRDDGLKALTNAFPDNPQTIGKGFSKLTDDALNFKNKDSGAALPTKPRCRIGLDGCFVANTPVLMANNPFKNVAPAMALATMPLVAPIQDVKVDDMVKAYHHVEVEYRNPDLAMASIGEEMYLTASIDADDIYVPGWQDYDYIDITPETWQVGKFVIIEEDGSLVEIEANRPKTWYKENNVNAIGDKAHFHMPEIGINGEATLLSIRPTTVNTTILPLNQTGQVDRPVITTFKRFSQVVYDYEFSNGTQIGATPEHPFYSVDRNAYIAVGELNTGEQVMTSGQEVVKFIAGKLRDKGEPVYNLEVWRAHNYYVGGRESGVFLLVHNSYPNIIKLSDWLKNPLIKGNKPKNFNNRGGFVTTTSGYNVPINEFGFPDFRQWTKRKPNGEPFAFTFQLGELTGKPADDFKLINEKFGFGNSQGSHLTQFPDYTWHHHEDGKTLMLVPKKLNNPPSGGLTHTGGKAVIEHNLEVAKTDISKILVFPSPIF